MKNLILTYSRKLCQIVNYLVCLIVTIRCMLPAVVMTSTVVASNVELFSLVPFSVWHPLVRGEA